MADYPLEVMLRPPVEMFSGAVSVASSVICFAAPSLMMMSPSVAMASASVLGGFGSYRIYQGSRVLKYQRNLKRLPRFTMSAKQIPVYKNYQYLGQGFKWTQVHSQRLKDTLSPHAQKYIEPSKTYKAVRQMERQVEDIPYLRALGKVTAADTPINPFRPLPPVGGNPVLHAVEMDEVQVLLPMSERVGHTLVLGTTRVGKSRAAEVLIEQDIRRGEGPVILFDPKSDAGLLSRMYMAAKREGREDDFYIFHLGFPEISARYNAVGNFARITEVAGRIAGQLSAEGNSAAFKEFAWRFINIVARALVSLGERPNYENILTYVTDIEPLFKDYMEWWFRKNHDPVWMEDVNDLEVQFAKQYKSNPRFAKYSHPRIEAIRAYVQQKGINDPIVMGLMSALRYDKTFFDKIVASLLPLLEKLTTGKIGDLLAPKYFDVDDDRPIFDWTQIIRKKGIVYVGLDAMTDTEVASAVGNSMFSDLVSTCGHIYKHGSEHGMLGGGKNTMPKICLHADEFNELMGDEFLPMVNKSGGSGMQITAYTQARGDIEARLGSKAKAKQVEANFNNLIMLRVKEVETAEYLTKALPEIEISQKMTVSGAADSSDVTVSRQNLLDKFIRNLRDILVHHC